MIVAHLPILSSRVRTRAAKTFLQMSAPLAELESLASVLSVAATDACSPVKPLLLALLDPSEQPPSASATQAPPRMKARDHTGQSLRDGALEALAGEIESCRRCARLVSWREQVAREKRPAHAADEYWGRPVAGFGDPGARIAILGLAPAAHGANRTGRVFTGDRSGDFLYAQLHGAGFANQAHSKRADDGLVLKGALISAAVRCAPPGNKPLPEEIRNCLPYLGRELELIHPRAILALGGIALNTYLDLLKRQ